MDHTQPLAIQVTAILYRDPLVFVTIRAHWDEGLSEIGAGTITLELPIPAAAAHNPEALRAAALEAIRASIDFETLRLWRGAPPRSE